MRTIVLSSLLLASSAPAAQYQVTLHFPNQSVQICASPGYMLGFLSLEVDLTECVTDTIFTGDMGG